MPLPFSEVRLAVNRFCCVPRKLTAPTSWQIFEAVARDSGLNDFDDVDLTSVQRALASVGNLPVFSMAADSWTLEIRPEVRQ